jgi:hypothetical protein
MFCYQCCNIKRSKAVYIVIFNAFLNCNQMTTLHGLIWYNKNSDDMEQKPLLIICCPLSHTERKPSSVPRFLTKGYSYIVCSRIRSYWGTMLQTGRSRVLFPMRSLDFSIDLILPAALWPWGRLSLQQKRVPGIFLGVKADILTAICERIV